VTTELPKGCHPQNCCGDPSAHQNTRPLCPDCGHEAHGSGTNADCEEPITHNGGKRMHRCLCLNQEGSRKACHPLMDCQGGPFGYADIYNLQRGRIVRDGFGRAFGPDFLMKGPIVAYSNPGRPGVLLCLLHGNGWQGLTPLDADDLPYGGLCTYGDPADPSDQCARDVMIPVCPNCLGDRFDPEDSGDWDDTVHMYNPTTRSPCPVCHGSGRNVADCSEPACNVEDELCDKHATEKSHNDGTHEWCDQTCQDEFPSEMLINGILYRALPGAGGMLQELLRRAADRSALMEWHLKISAQLAAEQKRNQELEKLWQDREGENGRLFDQLMAAENERDALASRVERLRIAWGMARTRARSAMSGADRYCEQRRLAHEALQDMLAGLLEAQIARDAALDRVKVLEAELRIGKPWKCPTCSKENDRDVCVICETDRPEDTE
jgi:hypothetical protein